MRGPVLALRNIHSQQDKTDIDSEGDYADHYHYHQSNYIFIAHLDLFFRPGVARTVPVLLSASGAFVNGHFAIEASVTIGN